MTRLVLGVHDVDTFDRFFFSVKADWRWYTLWFYVGVTVMLGYYIRSIIDDYSGIFEHIGDDKFS